MSLPSLLMNFVLHVENVGSVQERSQELSHLFPVLRQKVLTV